MNAQTSAMAVVTETETLSLLDQVVAATKPRQATVDAILENITVAPRRAPAPAPSMVMPFGKHKGRAINTLPVSYLNWLLTIKLYAPTRAAVREALGLDKSAPAPAPAPDSAPRGYVRLPAGTLRQIRVNREWIGKGIGNPAIVVVNGVETHYADVIIEGASRFAANERGGGCGVAHADVKRSVSIETTGSILVRK